MRILDKSKKIFKPKAPVRREAAAPPSKQASEAPSSSVPPDGSLRESISQHSKIASEQQPSTIETVIRSEPESTTSAAAPNPLADGPTPRPGTTNRQHKTGTGPHAGEKEASQVSTNSGYADDCVQVKIPEQVVTSQEPAPSTTPTGQTASSAVATEPETIIQSLSPQTENATQHAKSHPDISVAAAPSNAIDEAASQPPTPLQTANQFAQPIKSPGQLATPPASQATTKRPRSQVDSQDVSTEPINKRQRIVEKDANSRTKESERIAAKETPGLSKSPNAPVAPMSSKGRTRTRKSRKDGPEDQAIETSGTSAKKQKKSGEARKKKNDRPRQRAEQEPDAATQTNVDTSEVRRQKKGDGRKRKRNATLDEAEAHQTTPTEISMGDLCVDRHEGRISSRELRLRERDKEQAMRKKLVAQQVARTQLQDFMDNPEGTAGSDQPNGSESGNAPVDPPLESSSRPSNVPDEDNAIALLGGQPATQIINGQIVTIENSNVYDRHNAENNPNLEYDENASVIVEDDLSKRVNSASYRSRTAPSRWNPEMNELFYEGLRYFGMDFTSMLTLFPGKTRLQLKKKFMNERKADNKFIDQVLDDRRPIPSAEELQRRSGIEFRAPADVYKEVESKKKELLEAQRKQEEAEAAVRRDREKQVEEEGARLGVEIASRTPGQMEDEDSSDEEAIGNVDATESSDKPKKARTRGDRYKGRDDGGDAVTESIERSSSPELRGNARDDGDGDRESDDEISHGSSNEANEDVAEGDGIQDEETDYGDEVE